MVLGCRRLTVHILSGEVVVVLKIQQISEHLVNDSVCYRTRNSLRIVYILLTLLGHTRN